MSPLSADPEKRQRQLDALAEGRRTAARKWLGLEDGASPGSAGERETEAQPRQSPGSPVDYGEPGPEPVQDPDPDPVNGGDDDGRRSEEPKPDGLGPLSPSGW